MLPNMQGLVEDAMYVAQGVIPMSTEGIIFYQWSYRIPILPHSLINQQAYLRTRSEDSLKIY